MQGEQPKSLNLEPFNLIEAGLADENEYLLCFDDGMDAALYLLAT